MKAVDVLRPDALGQVRLRPRQLGVKFSGFEAFVELALRGHCGILVFLLGQRREHQGSSQSMPTDTGEGQPAVSRNRLKSAARLSSLNWPDAERPEASTRTVTT